MTTTFTTSRRLTLAATAFGLVSLLAGAASAHPVVTTGASIDAGVQVQFGGHPTGAFRHDNRYDRTDPYWRAMRQFDVNHNRLIDAGEKKAFWTYMASSGVYGSLSPVEVKYYGQLGFRFDANHDGRLVGVERRGMDRLIDSLRLFERLDRNDDRQLNRFEVGFSALAPRFYQIDRNGDRLVSRQEVRDDVLRAYRAGEC